MDTFLFTKIENRFGEFYKNRNENNKLKTREISYSLQESVLAMNRNS